jgi:salicylate hydroxylase
MLAFLGDSCPDDLPPEVSRQPGDLAEMHKHFENWDPRLRILLNKVPMALKWKIWSMQALSTWTKGSVALLGDACHPSVPYAASGAAMAVEDGAVLGRLLGLFSEHNLPKSKLPELLRVYEKARKDRTTTVVKTADGNRELYHMVDGPEQQQRDRLMKEHDWWDEGRRFPWTFGDLGFLRELYGFDAVGSAEGMFGKWLEGGENGV